MITILLLCYNTVTKAATRRVYLAYSSRGVIVHDNRAEMVDGRQLEQCLRAHIRNSKQEVGRTNWEWHVAFES